MTDHLNTDEIAALAWGIGEAAESAAWQAHLETCAQCRAELAAGRAALRELAGVEPPEAPSQRWGAMIQTALEEARPAPVYTAQPSRSSRAPSWIGAWGWRAAALVCVFLLGYHVGMTKKFAEHQEVLIIGENPGIERPALPTRFFLPRTDDASQTSASLRGRYLMVKAEDRPC